MPYTQVYDEEKECWVLKKVEALPALMPQERRRIHQADAMPHLDTVCLNCGQNLRQSHHWRNRYIMCALNRNFFEY